MQAFITTAILFISTVFSGWMTDFDKAQKESKETNHPVLLYFSGSDWCGPCIKMKKEVLESSEFEEYADDNLVLVNADFPRMKKNMLSDEQTKQNEVLAEKFNSDGVFPKAILISPEGKVLKTWEGYQKTNPEDFISSIKTSSNQ